MIKTKSLTLEALFICIAALLLFTTVPNALFPKVAQAQETVTELRLDYAFANPVIERGLQSYESVTIPGLGDYSVPGSPVVPFETARILIPDGQEVASIEVIPGEKSYLGEFYLQPGQEEVPIGYGDEAALTPPDKTVYDSGEPYPKELSSEPVVQWKCGYQIVILNLYPVQYIPKERQLSYFQDFEVVVTTRPSQLNEEESLLRSSAKDREQVASMCDNPTQLNSYDARLETTQATLQAYDYLIITNAALESASAPNFQTLQSHKNAKGVTTQIQTVEWIASNVSGSDLQEKIRNYIRSEYQTHGITYVLLGGDADGSDVGGESGDNIVPVRGLYAWNYECSPPNVPSDLYYSCLDGDYDYNNNGIYGEANDGPDGGEVDLLAEVYVGRAPVDSATELANFVNKTIAYENSTGDSYLSETWMVGEDLGWTPWGGDYKDEVKDGSSNWGYTTVGFPGSYNKNTLYDRDGTWSKSTLISTINSNIHIINHLGHANPTYVMRMSNSDVDALTNSEYFFGYSQGCYAGSFDNRTFYNDALNPCGYLSSDCIVEHFVCGAHGAFAFIANTRYGWGSETNTDGSSQYYDRQFWDAVFGEGIANLGKANQDSKEDNIGYVASSGQMRCCYYEITLFGDPETQLLPPASTPNIWVNPTGFDVTLAPGTSQGYSLEIGNDGGSTLTYNIGDIETTPTSTSTEAEIAPSGPAEIIEHENTIELTLSEPPSFTAPLAVPSELAYDDGDSEGCTASTHAGNAYAVRFTPPDYPVALNTARIFLDEDWPDSDHEEFGVNIYDDDGASGSPGTLLGSVNTTAANWGWWDVDISSLGITVTSGDFYVSYEQITASPDCEGLGYDDSAIDNRSWSRGSGDWSLRSDHDWMIRCVVDLPDCSWLDESSTSGSVPSGDSDMITVTINTTGLAVGDYSADIVIDNNAPVEDPTIVPVNLTVTSGTPPTMQTWAARNVIDSSAKLRGYLENLGSAASVDCYFEYGTTTAYGHTTSYVTMTATGVFKQDITGLSPGITYHYRSIGIGDSTGYGPDKTFTTVGTPPTVETWKAANVTATSGRLRGNLADLGSATSVDCYFEWGETTSYGNTTTPQAMTATGVFKQAISGLTPGTTYHCRAVAVGHGTDYGPDKTFTTVAGTPPNMETWKPNPVYKYSAKLKGNLADLGSATSVDVSFEWGTTTSYGNTTSSQTMTATGSFKRFLSGLTAGTTYHYRSVGVGDGTDYGPDKYFTTNGGTAPTVQTWNPQNTTTTSAKLRGYLSSLGSATTVDVYFEWGTTTSYGNTTSSQAMTATGVFKQTITGLSPGTTYHYRSVAVGSGTDYGPDKSFTTPS